MNILVFDTETTGLPDFRAPVDAQGQPWPCQIAGILFDENRKRRATLEIIVKPPVSLSPELTKIHGLDDAIVAACGYSPLVGCNMFYRLLSKADMVVAHNLDFDMRIMRGASMRAGFSNDDFFTSKQLFCTMKKSTDIVKCPPSEKMKAAGRHGYKNPSLAEAYRHFHGRDFSDAHTALADAEACAEIFWRLVDQLGIRLGESDDRSPQQREEPKNVSGDEGIAARQVDAPTGEPAQGEAAIATA